MSKSGYYKDPESIENRMKAMGFEPIQFSFRQYTRESDRSRMITTSIIDPEGIGRSGREGNRRTIYRFINKENEILKQTNTMCEMADWLEEQVTMNNEQLIMNNEELKQQGPPSSEGRLSRCDGRKDE